MGQLLNVTLATLQSLVYDIFILNVSNQQVQEKLCTEPKQNPLDELQFAIAYEDGLKRKRTIGNPYISVSVKEKPVFAVTQKSDNKECWRCRTGKFRAALLNNCKGSGTIFDFVELKDILKDAAIPSKKTVLEKMPIPANLTKGINLAKVCRKSIITKKTEDQKKK